MSTRQKNIPFVIFLLRIIVFFSAFNWTLSLMNLASAQPAYIVKEIAIDQVGTFYDINNNGQIVGVTPDQRSLVLWENDLIYNLGALPIGWRVNDILRINDGGSVVGWVIDEVGETQRAFRYDPGLGIREIGSPVSYAADINNSGQAVGAIGLHAFLQDGTAIIDLGVLDEFYPDGYSIGIGLNNAGAVVGWSAPSGWLSRGFLYKNGAMVNIGLPTTTTYYVWPRDINDEGVIIGTYRDERGGNRSFSRVDGAFLDLGNLGNDFQTVPFEINNSGQIVGSGWTASGASHAWLWEGGQMYDLNTLIPDSLNILLTEARSINDRGEILCAGLDYNYQFLTSAFFVLTPLSNPVAEAGGPYPGNVGSAITFDASGSSDPDGNIVFYEWDWNDDGIYEDNTVSATMSHTWSVPYTGNIRLRVTDNDGLTGMDTASVVVAAQPLRVSGGAYFYPESPTYRASFSLDVTGPSSPSGWLKYYYTRTRMNFVSTGITGVSVSGNTATISGTGTVNGVGGYTIIATVANGSPDTF